MHRLRPVIQPYAWGSRDGIARLQGRAHPTAEPEAELWMGAHEAAPSGVRIDDVDTTLRELIATDPQRWLGPQVAERFGGRLPFLLKVLAPATSLSIQAHPDADQARSATPGTYVDDWPKPEAWLALERSEAYAGSRPFEQIRSLATDLGVDAFSDLVARAASASAPAQELLRLLLAVPDHERAALVSQVITACQQVDDPVAESVVRVAEQHPGDIGLVVLLTMQRQVLQPGDYVFLAAGALHSLVSGLLVEILANSDNVVRAGLTPKRIDVPELLRIVDVKSTLCPEPPSRNGGWQVYPADTAYFQLRTRTLDGTPEPVPAAEHPRILLCLGGFARLRAVKPVEPVEPRVGESSDVLRAGESSDVLRAGESSDVLRAGESSDVLRAGESVIVLPAGESCFIAPGAQVVISGTGTAYLAAPGTPRPRET